MGESKQTDALADARQLLADIANHEVNPEDEAEKWLRAYGWPSYTNLLNDQGEAQPPAQNL